MTDRYERIRAALAMGPTPGPWDGDDNSVSRLWSNRSVGIREYIALPDSAEDSTPNPANMHFIAACDPDAIRELLAERDALEKVLREIAALDYKNAATNGAAYEAVQIARASLSALEPMENNE